MKIYYSKRKTHNLGNYENIVIQISAEDEVNSIVETKEECFSRLKSFVDSNLEEQLLEITKVKTEALTHDKVKNHVINIVKRDEYKRDIIKQYLISRYNVNKVVDLNMNDLIEFNSYLRSL